MVRLKTVLPLFIPVEEADQEAVPRIRSAQKIYKQALVMMVFLRRYPQMGVYVPPKVPSKGSLAKEAVSLLRMATIEVSVDPTIRQVLVTVNEKESFNLTPMPSLHRWFHFVIPLQAAILRQASRALSSLHTHWQAPNSPHQRKSFLLSLSQNKWWEVFFCEV